MKKHLFILAAVLTALVACNKPQSSFEPQNVVSGRSARVSISLIGGGATKALPVEADEAQVNTVDAFVFNSTGDLDAYGHYTTADFTTTAGVTTLNDNKKLECTTGAGKIVYIIINGNDSNLEAGEVAFASIQNEATLKARIFKLEDNIQSSSLNNFQMIGRTTGLTFKAGDNSVDVEVIRNVARVVIKKITKNFSNAGLATSELKVKNIYMSNAPGQYAFGDVIDGVYAFSDASKSKALAAAKWHNKYVPAVADPATPASVAIEAAYDKWLNRGLAAPVVFGDNSGAAVSKTAEVESTFYVMPNDVAWGYDNDSNPATPAIFGPVGGDTWSPRHTKLVIETEYAGKTYYYAIPIAGNGSGATYKKLGSAEDDGSAYAGIKANYSYEINELVLTRLGSTNPDEPTVESNVNFNITVQPWNVVLLGASGVYEI